MPTAAPPAVLIVEDDEKTAALIAAYLDREGFHTELAHSGREALAKATADDLRLVILDLMLPEVDGFAICQEIRERSSLPILMLSARDAEQDRVLGLTLGADDYVVKPFSPRELVARVKAILRRVDEGNGRPSRLQHGALALDTVQCAVSLHGRPVSVTLSELKLLEALMAAPGRVHSRQELLRHLYPGGESVVERVVDVHISGLRRKIEDEPARPRYIHTVRGVGYRFGGDVV